MILGMTVHAARAKVKAREVLRRKARQVGSRQPRHVKFQGRRGEVMNVGAKDLARERRQKSIQTMSKWLKLRARANAEEDGPRTESVVYVEVAIE